MGPATNGHRHRQARDLLADWHHRLAFAESALPMFITFVACMLAAGLNTLIHYEVLSALSDHLNTLHVPKRSKLLVVILATLVAHAVEMAVYGVAIYGLIAGLGIGGLTGSGGFSLETCMYFSAETYTSLGFGDISPLGPIRMIAGFEALHGLLMIGWSSSFLFISMERFWAIRRAADHR